MEWVNLEVGPSVSQTEKDVLAEFVEDEICTGDIYQVHVHPGAALEDLLSTLRTLVRQNRRLRFSLLAKPTVTPFPFRYHTNRRGREVYTKAAKRVLCLSFKQ